MLEERLVELTPKTAPEACWDPSQNARNGAVVTGLPCFPTLRFEEGCFGRPEDFWQHPVSRDAVLLPPLTTFY